jgi:transcription-repair coupling factor (superfamily II helicase)
VLNNQTEIRESNNVQKFQGINESQASYFLTCNELSKIVIAPDTKIAETILNSLEFFLGNRNPDQMLLRAFLPWEVLPFEYLSPTMEASAERLFTLYELTHKERIIVVTTVQALMQKIISVSDLRKTIFSIATSELCDRDTLIERLDNVGFVRSNLVEEVGQVAVRGAVVDFFPAGHRCPVRVELFGNTVQSIRKFDIETQMSIETMSEITVVPVRELILPSGPIDAVNHLKSRAQELNIPERLISEFQSALLSGAQYPGLEHLQPLFLNTKTTLWDYLTEDMLTVVFDEDAVINSANDFHALISERVNKAREEQRVFPLPETSYDTAESFEKTIQEKVAIYFKPLKLLEEYKGNSLGLELNQELHHELQLRRTSSNPLEPVANEVKKSFGEGVQVGIVVSQPQRVRRVQTLLSSYDIESIEIKDDFHEWLNCIQHQKSYQKPLVHVIHGAISNGFKVAKEGFQLISESEIFPDVSIRRKSKSTKSLRRILGDLSQLKENDYVVHIDHGVGIYRGLKQISVNALESDFILLEYQEGARLYVPVENISKVQKYIGGEGKAPALNKLGGNNWAQTKKKVRESVADLAGQLVSLYAKRELTKGHSFGSINVDDQSFADTFTYEETPDQQRAIEDVLLDMANDKPMDRLVCGDVGYGKTEVALRAAFKAANDEKQVVLLVPTTILADQHYETFKERFFNFAFNVGCVSRFFSTAQNKQTLAAVASGKIDIVIGTHRLLQRDVHFKNLGLVIIDEEHRFGVAHKEKLKRMRTEVDVLTLTATPIPRTLHMSLLGIRDLSIIATPPVDRHVIQTYLATYQPDIVREAILRELGRSGQVFFIHNRVQNIAMVADEISELVPEARISFAHGQMKENQLEVVMHKFIKKEIDVLVSTTIVESGLDIPNANTIIIRKAEKFGLAELYQLRGRVGRSDRRAYAYLLISDPKTLGADAKKRLSVLQSLDDLGMGFRLAVQDMEIRGAGNLLGRDQSGQVSLVGFDLYSRILKEAVRELQIQQGDIEKVREQNEVLTDPEINIGFPAHIPPDYIPDVGERLLLYQRLVDLRDDAYGYELAEEIEDRFGRIPNEVGVLIELMIFRSYLRRAQVISCSYRNNKLSFAFHPNIKISIDGIIAKITQEKEKYKLSPDMVLSINLGDEMFESPRKLYKYTKSLFEEFENLGAK